MPAPRLLAIPLAFAACVSIRAQAAIYTVGSGAGCTHATIQAAIDAADAPGSEQADEIRLSAGPYTGQRLTMHIAAAHGAITLIGGYATCASSAPTAGGHTVISGVGGSTTDPVLRVSNTDELILRNLEIRGAAGASGVVLEAAVGGAAPSRITLVDTLVVNNLGTTGGGLLIANYNPGTLPERLQVELQGASMVAYNTGYVRGGGVYCRNAMLSVRDTASIHDNSAGATGFSGSLDGGGIFAEDCQLDVSSTGSAGNGVIYRNSAALAGRGGGLYLTGANANADFYPVSAGASVVVSENRALYGGGIAIAGGARVRMFGQSVLLSNLADTAGGAIWLAVGGSAGLDSRFLMQSALTGAPVGAVPCLSPAYCATVQSNRAVDTSGNQAFAAVIGVSGSGGTGHALFRGARIEQNVGYSLFSQEAATSQIVLDGSLVVANHVAASPFVATGPGNAYVVSATTVANNLIDQPATLFIAPTTCDPSDDAVGTHLRRSIFWQPGQSLLLAFDPPQSNCFTHLIANNFGALAAASDRVIADPSFENTAGGDYRLSSVSPALDFAPAHASDATLDQGPRVIDLPAVTNLFGPQDLGAFERTYSPTVSAAATTPGGTIVPTTPNVAFGQPATMLVTPETGWHAITPFGGTCPAGTLNGTIYTTGPIIASCSVTVAFIHDTTLGIFVDLQSSVYGQRVSFSATFNGAATITGNVTFRDGATVLGSVPISGSTALLAIDRLDVGVHNITAQYAGDALNTPATSPTQVQTVVRAATTTTIAAPAPIRLGQSVTVSAAANVTTPGAGTPTGTIAVLVGFGPGSPNGGCTITLPAASCTLTPVGVSGVVTLSATYSGNANFSGSTGSQSLTVTPQIVRGSISGLTATGIALQLLVAGETVAIVAAPAGATQFQFVPPVPVGAAYLVNVDTQPAGLYCAVTNGSGTMPASDVVNVAVACSPAPHAILNTGITDGRQFARYGQTLTYTVTIGNIGSAAASGAGVALTASPGLNTAALAWSCTASGGASCGSGGTGGLVDSINVPINGLAIYTVTVPVHSTTSEPQVRLEINVNGGEVVESDIDTLVLLRNGFDLE